MLKYVTAIMLLSTLATPTQADGVVPIVGADRDAHGCIGSAGYLWCEHTNQCERPWELAAAQSFANTEEGFAAFCKQH